MNTALKLFLFSGGGLPIPDIDVTGNGSFGSTPVGTTDSEVFAVAALTADVVITAISVPSGFTHNAALPWTIEAGTSENFTITSTAASVGSFSGNVSITSNDPDENPFTFAISSTVTWPATLIADWDASAAGHRWQDSARTTLATADGDVIGALDDLSVNAYHKLQPTTANKGVLKLAVQNGLDIVRLDGTDDFLVKDFGASYAQPNTLFIVANMKSASGDFLLDTPSGVNRTNISSAGGTLIRLNSGANLDVNQTLPTGVVLWRFVMDGASSNIFKNGVLAVSGNAGGNAMTGVTLAARFNATFFGEIDFCQMVLLDNLLSAGEITAVEAALNEKWAVY